MEGQQNSLTPDSQVKKEPEAKGSVPTIFGVIIICIVAATIAFFALLFIREKSEISAPAPITPKTETKDSTDSNSAPSETDQVETVDQNPLPPESKTTSTGSIDLDYEEKQLENQLDSVKDSDFNETDYSDSSLGV